MNLDQTKFVLDVVPQADGQKTLTIDLYGIAVAEARLAETAKVTDHTAPELLSFFNKTWLRLNEAVTALMHHRNQAENAYQDAQADVLVTLDDDHMEAKGFKKSSADVRKAMIGRDPGVKQARDRLDNLKTVLLFVQGKAKAFERAYRDTEARRRDGRLPPLPLRGGNPPPVMAGPAQDLQDGDPWATTEGPKTTAADDELLAAFGATRY